MNHLIKLLATSSIVFAAIGNTVAADSYPERAITLIVPFAPGASADGIARIIGRKLSASFGKPVVVDNRPGAGGATGLMALAKSAPDGYTIGMGATGAIVINPHLPDAAPLNPQKQLMPLAKVADIPLVFVSAANQPKTIRELVDRAKNTKDGLSYGTPGQYTSQHLAGELLASMAKTPLVAIPYKGSAPALTDVLGGQIPAAVVDLTSAAPHIKTGKVNAVAVTSASRSSIAPEIPTIAESGVPSYSAPAWMGMFLPVNTPAAIASRLSGEIKKVMADPEVQREIMTLAAEPGYLGPQEFQRFIDNESKKWASVIGSIPKPSK